MNLSPQIFTAKVMHKRLFPKVNTFTYGLYYLAMPLPAARLPGKLQQFPADDLGYRDGRCPEVWAREVLAQHHLAEKITNILLLTMPRVLGYVFNPVSFYLCFGQSTASLPPAEELAISNTSIEPSFRNQVFPASIASRMKNLDIRNLVAFSGFQITQLINRSRAADSLGSGMTARETGAAPLIAIICEVHNTFGEQHSYLCCHADHRPITADDWLEAEKVFHVSPFLERSGQYRFRFAIQDEKLGIWIDFYDAQSNKQLITSLIGTLAPLTQKSLLQAFWRHPLITLKAIALIHWQAAKLVAKGIRYIPKPLALKEKITLTHDLTKM